ncbi:CNNM domain-containing protein [Sphaerisporangium sp. TRM90804]|uniref:CNNM domain-containing protein n=1 Tax=Sphaerisporangium sp. TRM90804 TaxID=3031113 RepID=UPI00244AF78C|nr:CNNM domain-containing protein [Sphaerisporangium sp. TRM90804]MDH2425312.1 CNNM domain-containing protein [Sphaerisporangium sp. TRM90804]
MSLPLGLALTILLLVGNGFFVASEFALVAAKRHRLEKAAAHGSRAAATAVKGIRELSLMLAGAQLGITLCSLGLGVVSEPLIAGTLAPLFHTFGLPDAAAHAVAFVIALGVVTFLHMVIGEMAPKSWAIAHPERSAMILAPAFRGFTVAVRPILRALNGVSNLLLRLLRVRPRDEISNPRTPAQLRRLVEESRRLGLIDTADHAVLTQALRAPAAEITPLVTPAGEIVGVSAADSPQDVIDVCARTGRTRLVVLDDAGAPAGVVHVRDAYLARRRGARSRAGELAYRLPELPVTVSVSQAVAELRAASSQLAVVRAEDGTLAGLVSLDALLSTLLIPA